LRLFHETFRIDRQRLLILAKNKITVRLGWDRNAAAVSAVRTCIILFHSNYAAILLSFRYITAGRTTDRRCQALHIRPLLRVSTNTRIPVHVCMLQLYLPGGSTLQCTQILLLYLCSHNFIPQMLIKQRLRLNKYSMSFSDYLKPVTRISRHSRELAYQSPIASADYIKFSFFPRTACD